jgi:uracil-DNA glycosylase family 4
MTTGTNDNLDGGVRAYLPWLIDMGADEIILDRPVNRFAEERRETAPVPPALPQPPKMLRPSGALLQSGDLAADAMALAAGASAIAELTDAWLAFEAHPLKRTATRLCFFNGSTEARVLVLSDKPRSEEDPMGEVLSAKHQALAENMLAAIGLCGFLHKDNLEQVALANFVPWRPPGNRAVIELEARLSVPFIHRLFTLLMPKAVLCLGALPGQYLTDGEPAITRARGKWRNVEVDGHQFPLMTTFHPETLLKSPQSKKLAWQDLQAFRDRLNEA